MAWVSQPQGFIDECSIGVVLLELVVGPELVLYAKNSEDIRGILIDCKQYIDDSFLKLVESMVL